MANRLQECINYLISVGRISNTAELAERTKKQKSYVSEVLSGKRSISEQFVHSITNVFPEISDRWLLSGEGEMTEFHRIYDRINIVLANEGISKRDFEKGTNTGNFLFPGVYRKAENNPGDLKVAAGWIDCILNLYPKYSERWLTYGEGDMYNSDYADDLKHPVAHPAEHESTSSIPLIPFDAIAGYGSFDFQELPVEDYYTISELRGADFLIRVKGDSMSPKYNGGDIVACKRIDAITFWQWHKVYAICTRNQGILIKRVEEYPNNPAFITLKSENPIYHPFELHEDEIISVAIVLGAIVLE